MRVWMSSACAPDDALVVELPAWARASIVAVASAPTSAAAMKLCLHVVFIVLSLLGSVRSFHFFDVRQHPRPIKVRFGGGVQAEVGEPCLAGHGRNPVLLEARWRLRADVEVHRAVSVLHEIGLARGTVGKLFLVVDQAACA